MNGNGFRRTDHLFSLCGLNCSLCPMFVRGDCGGCFTDSPCYPSCPIAPCSVAHGHVEHCFECPEYPCKRYDGIDRHDSLISHRNQKKDMEKAKRIGIEAYNAEQLEKKTLLDRMLAEYDDGFHDVFFCLAANMLAVSDLTDALAESDRNCGKMSPHQRAEYLKKQLSACAARRNIPLVLRR